MLARVDDPVTGDATITASGLGFGFAIGGTPFRGLAFGLTGSTTGIVERDFDRETPRPSGGEQSVGFISYGLFVKYWPNPRGGFQLEAVGGIATLWASEDDEPAFGTDHSLPVGPSFSTGVGLQTWMKPQHSIGAVARLVYAPLFGDWSATVLMPTLSMIVSFH